MAAENPTPDDVRRRFGAMMASPEMSDLAGEPAFDDEALDLFDAGEPELRRPPLEEARVLVVRVDLDFSQPRIWRRVELDSEIDLEALHFVLMALFDWSGRHLWRFAVGGSPFEAGTQRFLCDADIEEGDLGEPASETEIDEVLQEPGDILHYVYDYGDGWELTLTVEEVREPGEGATPLAWCTGGRRAAPPEDCGGLLLAEELVKVLDDPTSFDIDEVNERLGSPLYDLLDSGINPALASLAIRLAGTDEGDDLLARVVRCAAPAPEPSSADAEEALAVPLWFLRRAGADLPLTPAGYLKPDALRAVAAIMPTMEGWIGTLTREVDARPVLWMRLELRDVGLLRKHKDKVLLTRLGRTLRNDPVGLWNHLATQLLPSPDDAEAYDASLLVLTYLATGQTPWQAKISAARAMALMGWRLADGAEPDGATVHWLFPGWTILNNLTPTPPGGERLDRPLAPAAGLLARTALAAASAAD